ncbi:transposase : Transposase OS=Microcystis aeruginosa DIANCHI905 GN=C789_5144 PE=4 SV=1: DDE_3 [Gemmataceae bacterium]|nr:transposase : Transposase OS=Microcystis aeruginosa DIANCHI905 GN=C789_5144 PE=4 SV=1: DDE_3 [Gemmataceae bacterium]VTT97864.1 transposase : Transposase OS=Microcystis aeruginosa DIANCHI905 GN=C789_5144 PE=4 SV=1: DDE_3 [Gemmataceae bacterium]
MDGRSRRKGLVRKHAEPPASAANADRVKELADAGHLLADVAAELEVDRNTVTSDTRVSSDTMVEFLGQIATQTKGAITVVLDSARYQRCEAVETEAKRLGIELLLRPSYSPNLNLIERLWNFMKKEALRGKHYPDFGSFLGVIEHCLNRIHTYHRDALPSLMTLKFQTFDNASIMAA